MKVQIRIVKPPNIFKCNEKIIFRKFFPVNQPLSVGQKDWIMIKKGSFNIFFKLFQKLKHISKKI